MDDRTEWIGLRVARWRDAAGMTQQELADRIGVSGAYMSMMENGRRPITKRSTLLAIATTLGVSFTDLTAQPYPPRSVDELAIWHVVPAVRDALDEDPPMTAPRTLAELAMVTDEAMSARMACDYPRLARILPGLIAETRLLANEGDEQRAALALFVRAAFTSALTLKPFGHVDLGMRLAERARRGAELLGEADALAAADFAVAQCALAGGARRRSLRTALDAAATLEHLTTDAARSWYGMLHLHAALTAGSLGDSSAARSHLQEAATVAGHTRSDPWLMEFSGTNVDIWRVGVALENGEPEKAPGYARKVDRGQIRTAHRQARLHIDTGRAWYQAGDTPAAVRQFLMADDIAAQEVRSRPSVREIVGQMVRDARRAGGHDELRTLAVRIGLDPLDPPEPTDLTHR